MVSYPPLHSIRLPITIVRTVFRIAILAVDYALCTTSLLFTAELFPYAPLSPSQQRSVEQQLPGRSGYWRYTMAGSGSFKGNGPVGVYWALTSQLKLGWSIGANGTMNYGNTSGNTILKDLYFLVLLDDGRAYWRSFLPDGEMHRWDQPPQSDAMYPYKIDGNNGSIRAPNREYAFSVKGRELIVDGEEYHPLPSVDGVTLEGNWYQTDFDDMLKAGTYPFGYLTLTKDGRFSDNGMLTGGWSKITQPGDGTYQIRDYTLILSFSDGRKEQLSFYSLQSPITDHAFIGSYNISKLK